MTAIRPEGARHLGAEIWFYRTMIRKDFGAGRGNRTPDPEITNHVLYQLSYTGAVFENQWSTQSRSRFPYLSLGSAAKALGKAVDPDCIR